MSRPLVLALLLGFALVASPAEGAERTRAWRAVLDGAAQAAEERAYTGESLWVTYENGVPSVSTFLVQSTGDGEISVLDRTRYAVRLGDDGGSLADYERGWFFPLPAADLAKAHKGLNRLEAKYAVDIVGREHLLDRPSTLVEITRREDGALVERLWVDDESELLLRRETYAGQDNLLRMVAYLKLDLDPEAPRGDAPLRPSRGQRPGQERREQAVLEVDELGRAALRDASWVVPEQMPGDYAIDGAFALSAEDTQPLQTVYSDGLYTVSLFEQRGRLDPATLPEGHTITNEYGFEAYTWQGAVPHRVVWEAGGATWSLVGDAPPEEFAAIVASLPSPQPDRFADRIQRGFGRLWSWVSPWA